MYEDLYQAKLYLFYALFTAVTVKQLFACFWPECFSKISVVSTRTHDRGEEAQLSSEWISIGSELSSLNFDSFAILYPNVVIKSLCGNLDICPNYFLYAYTFTAKSCSCSFDLGLPPNVNVALSGGALEQFSRFHDRNGCFGIFWHYATCGHWEGRPKFNHGQTMAEIKLKSYIYMPYESNWLVCCCSY